jgi:hypothetical protein
MVGLVATDGKRVVAALMRRAALLPRVSAHPARVEPALPQLVHDIRNSVAHHPIASHAGKKVAFYSGSDRP